jgi:hypothetical protein
MERSIEFNNQTVQIEKHIICINDKIEINQIKEERKIPSLQIDVSRVSKEFDEKKTKQTL